LRGTGVWYGFGFRSRRDQGDTEQHKVLLMLNDMGIK
jgi:hypothetical protein